MGDRVELAMKELKRQVNRGLIEIDDLQYANVCASRLQARMHRANNDLWDSLSVAEQRQAAKAYVDRYHSAKFKTG